MTPARICPACGPTSAVPKGGDPPIPSPGSANDPFPIEYVLRNGNVQLGDGRELPIASVCAPTVVRSDGRTRRRHARERAAGA